MDERHCGNDGWHLAHHWGQEWDDMGDQWFECPGSYPRSDPRSTEREPE